MRKRRSMPRRARRGRRTYSKRRGSAGRTRSIFSNRIGARF